MTLLRSVGWLSRDDLRTRGGAAGPQLAAPGARCLGPATFSYGLVPVVDGWISALGPAAQLATPPRLWAAAGIPDVDRTVSLGAPGLVLSAMKRSADGRYLVVRA